MQYEAISEVKDWQFYLDHPLVGNSIFPIMASEYTTLNLIGYSHSTIREWPRLEIPAVLTTFSSMEHLHTFPDLREHSVSIAALQQWMMGSLFSILIPMDHPPILLSGIGVETSNNNFAWSVMRPENTITSKQMAP